MLWSEAGEGGKSQVAEVEDTKVQVGSRSEGRSLLRRIVIYVPSRIVPAILTLATSMIFTRIFNPVAYGKYSLFLVYAAPIELLFIEWLDQSIGKFLPPAQLPEDRRRVKDAIFVSIALIFLAEVGLAAGVLVAGKLALAREWQGFLLPTALFVLTSSLFDLLAVVFAAEYRAKEYTSYQLIDSVFTFGLRLFLVSSIFSMDIRLMFWSVVISHLVLLPFMWVRGSFPAPRQIVRVLESKEVRHTARAFLTFGLPMTIFFVSSVLLDVGDRYVLNFLRGAGSVGVYDANYRLVSGVVVLMVAPVTIALHPYLMRIAGGSDRRLVEQSIGSVVENLLLMGMLTVGLTILLHRDIARVVLGSQFRAGSVVMPAVVAGVFFFNIGTFVHKPFEIVGRTRVMLLFAVIAAVANIGFCFALIPPLGYNGAAYATLLAYVLYTICVGYLGRRIYPWRLNARRLATFIGSLAAGLVTIYILRRAISGLPYGWSLAVTAVASCLLASTFLFALLRTMLKPGRPGGRTGPRHAKRSSWRSVVRSGGGGSGQAPVQRRELRYGSSEFLTASVLVRRLPHSFPILALIKCLVRNPALIRALISIRRLPVVHLQVRRADYDAWLEAPFSPARRGRLAQAVLNLPTGEEHYLAGRQKQALRTNLRHARDLEVTSARVTTYEEWFEAASLILDARHAEHVGWGMEECQPGKQAAYYVARDAHGIPLACARVALFDQFAVLYLLLSRPDRQPSASWARYQLHTFLALDLGSSGVKHLLVGSALRETAGTQYFQYLLGYRARNLRFEVVESSATYR